MNQGKCFAIKKCKMIIAKHIEGIKLKIFKQIISQRGFYESSFLNIPTIIVVFVYNIPYNMVWGENYEI